MDAKWWWLIGMLGPLGAMGLIRAALTSYNDWRAAKTPKLSFGSTEQVEALESVFAEFVPRVFGFGWDECFISDESSLLDFTSNDDELAELHERIRCTYDVDVRALPDERLVTIAAAIASRGV